MSNNIKIVESRNEYLQVLFIRTFANFLILASLFFVVRIFFEPVVEEIRYSFDQLNEVEYIVADTDYTEVRSEVDPLADQTLPDNLEEPTATPQNRGTGFADLFRRERVQVIVPEDPQFSLVIPKIGANARVVANVNPESEEEYLDALKYGIAHARGSTFPGEGDHTFLFAHSTDYIWNIGSYNAVFYLLYKLDIGDEVNVFYEGQRYVYEVREKVIINPDQVEYLQKRVEGEQLTLQTCWPPGTIIQRLMVFAELKSDIST